jgi:hypothetical protein
MKNIKTELSDWWRHFKCWFRYGHFWKEVGPTGINNRQCTMYQCVHCTRTEIIDDHTYEVV